MPRGRRAAQQTGDTTNPELDDLILTPPNTAIPDHLGNFENHRLSSVEGLDRPELRASLPEQDSGTEGEPADEVDTSGETALPDSDAEADRSGEGELDEGEMPDSEGPPGSQADLASLRQDYDRVLSRLESQERELQFLRQGAMSAAAQPATARPHPLESVPLPFAVTEQDLSVLMGGGPQAVEIFNRALQLTATATARHTAGVLAQAYTEAEATKTTGTNIVQQFYGQNPDLQPYTEILQGQANAVWNEMPYASPEVKMSEVARRTRERLRSLGISTQGRTKPARGKVGREAAARRNAEQPRQERIRPAEMEMGAGRRGNGVTRLTPLQKEMYELIQR